MPPSKYIVAWLAPMSQTTIIVIGVRIVSVRAPATVMPDGMTDRISLAISSVAALALSWAPVAWICVE